MYVSSFISICTKEFLIIKSQYPATHPSSAGTIPDLPISITGDDQDLVVGDDSYNTVAGASQEPYDAMGLEDDENKDAGDDNHDYHHVIGRIADVLENIDLDAM